MTPSGKILTGLVALTSMGTISTQVPVYQVCCALLGLLASAELFGLLTKPELTVKSNWPRTLEVGQTTIVPLRVTNNSSWRAAYDVMLLILRRPADLWHTNGDQFVGKIGPQQSAEMQLELCPQRRGRIRIAGIDAHSTFPFNLVRIPGGRTAGHEFIVYPAAHPLTRLDMPVGDGALEGQFVLSGQVGDSTEYLGNREYSPGEPIRRLDFRAWARLGRPIVREYQDEFASRVALIVDTVDVRSRLRKRLSHVEPAISLAASVIDGILDDDYQLSVLATGADIYSFSDDPDSGFREEAMEQLALTVATRTPVYRNMLPMLLAEVERCAAVLIILASWGEQQQELVRELSLHGPPLKVVLIHDGDVPDSFDGDDRIVVTPQLIREGGVAIL